MNFIVIRVCELLQRLHYDRVLDVTNACSVKKLYCVILGLSEMHVIARIFS
jgi:hypothetical protein